MKITTAITSSYSIRKAALIAGMGAMALTAGFFVYHSTARAVTCGVGELVGGRCVVFLIATGAGTFTVPADWNNASNTVEVIGAGGAGDGGVDGNRGGGGGAYAKVTNLSLSGVINYSMGAGGLGGNGNGGNGGSTYFNGSGCSTSSVCAAGGSGATGSGSGSGGAGGTTAASVGTVIFAGGSGGNGNSTTDTGGGGGGAAGPLGAGRIGGAGDSTGSGQDGGGGGGGAGGSASTIGSAGNADGGAGGRGPQGTGAGIAGINGNGGAGTSGGGGGGGDSSSTSGGGYSGGAGGTGIEWDATHGAGGGGGGSGNTNSSGTRTGGAGGKYGGGGGGGLTGGSGGQGIIVITYTPVTVPPAAASNPVPPSGSVDQPTSIALSWTGASNATSHSMYLGTDPALLTLQATQASTSYAVSGLLASTTYYWRVDSANSAGTTTGTIWSFTTVSFGPSGLDLSFCDAIRTLSSGILCAIRPSSIDSRTKDVYDPNSTTTADQMFGFGYHVLAVPNSWNTATGTWVHLDGSYGRPYDQNTGSFQTSVWLGELMEQGYAVLEVAYNNRHSVNADLCGSASPGYSRDNCAGEVRQENLTGADASPYIDTDQYNSIDYRLNALVAHLHAVRNITMPGDIGTTSADWARLRVSGHSQGANQTYYIAKQRPVAFGCVLAGGYDVPDSVNPGAENIADWLTSGGGMTPVSRLGGIIATEDDSYSQFNYGLQLIGLTRHQELMVVTQLTFTDDSGASINGHAGTIHDPSLKPYRAWTCLDAAPLAPLPAFNPAPSHGSLASTTTAVLSWIGDGFARLYNVHFGTNPDVSSSYVATQSGTTYSLPSLTAGTTYYWRIDSGNEIGTTTGAVWSFTASDLAAPVQAVLRAPVHSVTGVSTSTTLSWVGSDEASQYAVYFGTDPALPAASYLQTQTGTFHGLSPLSHNTTYYWRIDAANAAGTTTGPVWSFTTGPQSPTTYQTTVTSNVAYGPDPAHLLDVCAPVTSATNTPAVIFIHGGGWVQGDKSDMSNLCNRFARNGIVGININHRLLDASTTPPTNSYPTPTADVQLVTRWLRANAATYNVNPDAICAFGRSSGAHLSMLLGTHQATEPTDMSNLYPGFSSQISCVIEEYGPSDLMLYPQSQDPDRWKAMGNYAIKGDAGMIEASPRYKVNNQTTPMMIVHGEQDTNIIFQHAILMRDALQASDIPVRFVSYPNASHHLPELTLSEKAELINNEIQYVSSIIGRK